MLKFKRESFGKLRFDPTTDQKMLAVYPDLCEIIDPAWTEDPNLDKLLRYVIMVYDPESPVYKNESETNKRKEYAVELCGFDIEDSEFIQSIFKNEYCFVEQTGEGLLMFAKAHVYLPKLTTSYLKRFPKSKEHAAMCALEFHYWEIIFKMFEPISGKNSKEELESVQKKDLISDRLGHVLKNINTLYKDFFAGDEELAEVVERQVQFNPESIGHVLKNKKR